MDRHEREALDRWITREPEYMVENEEINDWGMAFINRVDEVINDPDTDPIAKNAWIEGDAEILDSISIKSYLTDEQWEWVETFLSEI